MMVYNTTQLGKVFAKKVANEKMIKSRRCILLACSFGMLVGSVLLAVFRYYGILFVMLLLFCCYLFFFFATHAKFQKQWNCPSMIHTAFSNSDVKVEAKQEGTLRTESFGYDKISGIYPGEKIIFIKAKQKLLALDISGFENADSSEFLKEIGKKVKSRALRYERREAARNFFVAALLLLPIGIMAVLSVVPYKRTNAQFVTLPDSTKVDITDVLDDAGQAKGSTTLLDPQKYLLRLSDGVYLDVAEWSGVKDGGSMYLPILLYEDGGTWNSTVYGSDAADLTGKHPASHYDIAATFVQQAGEYLIINVGSQFFLENGLDPVTPTDSRGTMAVHLSSEALGIENAESSLWVYYPVENGTVICAGSINISNLSCDILVIHDLPDDYSICCGESVFTAADILGRLAEQKQGNDIIYGR